MATNLEGMARLREAILNFDGDKPEIDYKEPGAGAVEYAREFMKRKSFTSAMPIVQQLMEGELHDETDKRIKRCAWCRYYYRDATRPNNSVVCSVECRDSRRKASQRMKHVPKPKKPTMRERYYAAHLEYPFWTASDDNMERVMLSQTLKHELPCDEERLDVISGARQLSLKIGGRKKNPEVISYNGNEKGVRDIRVKFSERTDRSHGEVTSYKMLNGGVGDYMLEKFGADRLEMERRHTDNMKRQIF